MNKRTRVISALLVGAAAFLLWLVLRGDGGETPLAVSGTVEATEADLGFQVPGRIERIDVREGDEVAAGQALAALDAAGLEAARSAATAQVDAVRSQLLQLERGARPQEVAQASAAVRSVREREDEARREAERADRLFEGGAVSRSDRDRAATALQVAIAAREQAEEALGLVREGPRTEVVDAQRAVVRQAEANLERTRAALTDAVVVAPFAGRITVRHREPGESVGPGAPVLTLLDPSDRWVRIYVPEDRVGRVAIGQSARVTSDSWPDRVYQGQVVNIGSEAEFTPRNVQTPEERTKLVYPVKVRITDDPDFDLKPGIPADVTLVSGEAGST